MSERIGTAPLEPPTQLSRAGSRCGLALRAAAAYFATTLVVVGGVWWGVDFLERRESPYLTGPGLLAAMGNRDGVAYALIAKSGYSYDRQKHSSVAYFPAFPLLGRAISKIAPLTAELALLIVSHLSLFGVFGLMAAYVRHRQPEASSYLTDWTLLALGLWPTSLFFRMAYSESLFVFAALASMYAMLRAWPAWRVAALVGFATACRPVGVAVLAPFGWYLWQTRTGTAGFLFRAFALAPVASWGILAYMVYQHETFGDALAFVKAQDQFAGRLLSQREQFLGAMTLEPIWSKYDPSSSSYWARGDDVGNAWFSIECANPIYFLVTLVACPPISKP